MTSPAHILVVDDERHVRSALCRLLRRMGLETVEAGTAEAALEELAARPFACALVDLRMPGMGGMELVRRARADLPDLPILVVTGHGDADEARRCAQLGVSDFVMKPWSNAELQLAVMRVLEGGGAGAERSEEPARPETLRIGTRVCDGLRRGPLPARFRPPAAFASGELWGGAAAVGRGLAQLARSDEDLCARLLTLAEAELGLQLPLEGVAGLLGPERTGLLLALAAVQRAHEPEEGPPDAACRGAFLHAWMRAVAMRTAAEELPGSRVEPRRAFLAGLFADLGAVALVSGLDAQGVHAGEALRFAADRHAAASAWIAAEWHLPGECVVAAAQHHTATTLYRADPLLVLLWASEETAAEASGATDVSSLPHGPDAAKLAGLGVGERFELERACRKARERLGAALGCLAPDPGRRVA
jgi:CheY-like chemotaxis protein